jgi:hypothetical protein
MPIMKILGRFSGITSIAFLSFVAGVTYIADCRRAGGAIDQCWLTGLPIAGLGGTAAGGFATGYGTFNPDLRSPSPSSRSSRRDTSGRFAKPDDEATP